MTKSWEPIRYRVESDTVAIEIRPWPGSEGDAGAGYDAGPDLVIHDAPDGRPWLWEIEHASRHPEHIAAALAALRRARRRNDDTRPHRRGETGADPGVARDARAITTASRSHRGQAGATVFGAPGRAETGKAQ
jgi:hypothetical protein